MFKLGYKFEEIIKEKAKEFIKILEKNGFKARIRMFRDYMCKIAVSKGSNDYGNLLIYYKAKLNSFSLKTHELKDSSIKEYIMDLWMIFTGEKFDGFVEEIKTNKDIPEYKVYVDGSYYKGQVGYGFVVLKGSNIIKEFSGTVSDPPYNLHHQVGGEIKAVEEAIKFCIKNGIKRVAIFHDFSNLEKWVTGEFKTNNELTRNYKDFVAKSGIEIVWIKVESHSGVKWNEYVDKLAKRCIKT